MVKKNSHDQMIDLPFGTWNVAADEINAPCNNVHLVDMLCKNLDLHGFIFHGELSKEHCSLKATLLTHQMKLQHDVLTRSGRHKPTEEKGIQTQIAVLKGIHQRTCS